MSREDFFTRWSALHGGAKVDGIVRWWLKISYRIAITLKSIHISPNSLTSLGVILALGLYLILETSDSLEPTALLLALALLVLSLTADGVDGSLAIITEKSTRFGATWDAIADRISESFWAWTFVLLGADYRIVLAAWLLAAIQEYIRARSAGLGMVEIALVTICERPVRASLLAIAIVAQFLLALTQLELTILNTSLSGAFASNVLVMLWLIMQVTSVAMLWLRTASWMKSEH